jgi:chromosome segregation ATPase
VVLPAPDGVIARDLADGVPPSEALARWWKAAGAWMACFRRMRQRLVLLDEASLARSSPVCVDALAHRLERDLSVPDGAAAGEGMPSENLALFRVIAAHLLKQDPQVRRLAEQIDALTVSDRDRVALTPERLDAACADLLTAREQTDAENALLRETVGELRETLSASQRDTERLRHALGDAEKARSLAVAAQNTATEERAGLEAARDDTRQQLEARVSEVETVKRQLSARAEDAEKLRRALSETESARDRALAGQKQTEAALETAVQDRAMLEQSVQVLQEDLVQSRQQVETGMVDAQMRETALESEYAASAAYRAQCTLREEVMGAAILDLNAGADQQFRQLETAQATALDEAPPRSRRRSGTYPR